MLIFLYGPDSYRINRKLNEIIEQYQKIHKSGLNLRYFDLSDKDMVFQDFSDEFQQKSMFKEKKLIVLKNAFSHPGFQDEFLSEIKRLAGA